MSNLGDVIYFFLKINCKMVKVNRNDNDNNLNLVKGIKLKYNKIDQNTLIYLLQYYLILNEYYIYNNSIYKKIETTLISYKLIGTIKEVLYDKFQENVVRYFYSVFEYYFEGFDFNYLLATYFIKSKNIIENLKDISTNRIELDFNLMEFNDGIYSIKYDRFMPKNSNLDFSKRSTVKYYDKSYSSVRQSKPQNWLRGLQNALNIINIADLESNEQFLYIIKAIALIFQKEKQKKSTLFIHGQSNTGKTTLITNPLENYFGLDNIGSIISSKNFKWQEIIGKFIAIIDEGRYSSGISSDLLKLLGGEYITVERKYSKEHIEIRPIPMFILSNKLFNDPDENINAALINRLITIEFINTISNENSIGSGDFKNKIKDEEANIIVYCNKLVFNIIKEKRLRKGMKNYISIKKI